MDIRNNVNDQNQPSTECTSSLTSLDCKVCNDSYSTQGLKVPRLLNCGHTLCHECLCHLYQNCQGSLVCPFDRQSTYVIGESGVWGLKKNFALIEFLEKLQQQTSPPPNGSRDGQQNFQTNNHVPEPQVLCDENEEHVAALFCIVCESHLCLDCSERTHNQTKTLSRHRRVPLCEKPQPRAKCSYHSAYALEFVCLESQCCSAAATSPNGSADRLMCLLCRDYGRHERHKHALLEPEAAKLREKTKSAYADCRRITAESQQWAERVARSAYQIERPDGTADMAKRQVKKHFSELRRLLLIQETAATTVIESHIRDRLSNLRARQSELVSLASVVLPHASRLELTGRADDARLVERQPETEATVEAIRKYAEEMALLFSQLNVDTKIHISFTKDNRLHIGPKIEMRVVSLGLDGAGKSTILFKLKLNELLLSSTSTIGFNVETIEYKNLKLTVWDVGGLPKLRPLWKHYYLNTQALVFVIDSFDRDRLAEVQSELVKLLSENELRDASLLIYANKQDLSGCMNMDELMNALPLSKLCYGRSWFVQPCSAVTGAGLWEGLEWLASQLVSSSTFNDADDETVESPMASAVPSSSTSRMPAYTEFMPLNF